MSSPIGGPAAGGFHYPVDTYLEAVYARLSPGGCLILDVRRDTGGLDLLRGRFGNIARIAKREKHDRVVCIKEG